MSGEAFLVTSAGKSTYTHSHNGCLVMASVHNDATLQGCSVCPGRWLGYGCYGQENIITTLYVIYSLSLSMWIWLQVSSVPLVYQRLLSSDEMVSLAIVCLILIDFSGIYVVDFNDTRKMSNIMK